MTPELEALLAAIDARPPTALTACQGWTVHELTCHLAAGADEMLRHVEPLAEGRPVPPTRSFEEREAPYRAMEPAEVRNRLRSMHERVEAAFATVLAADPAATLAWTGRTVPLAFFAAHSRSEAAIHHWDVVGDTEAATELLSDRRLVGHAVTALGPLLVAGAAGDAGEPFTARLRRPEGRDVELAFAAGQAELRLMERDDGVPALHGDGAAILLTLWGRRPNPPERLRSDLPPGVLRRVLAVLGGY